jgi:hypothetical protein
MLPTNATPLNDGFIRVLIEEHQAEIRRCFAPRPDGGRVLPGWRFLSLRRRPVQASGCLGTGVLWRGVRTRHGPP